MSHPSTQALHADDPVNRVSDVAPPIHLSTTFRYPDDPDQLIPSEDPVAEFNGKTYVYAREFAPNTTRLEAILTQLLHGHAISYTTGLAALHAALTALNPQRIAVLDGGYHGSHEVISVHSRLSGLQKLPLDCAPEALHEGDVVLLETPLNPHGTALSIEAYARKIHSRGGYLIVDSTFAPPGLQEPFAWGADVVLHSGSKYFGGHSDLLCGVLAVRREDWKRRLLEDRIALGTVMGNMESWLGVRSLRTLEVRVQRASFNAGQIVEWLGSALRAETPDAEQGVVRAVVGEVFHASLQQEEWVGRQMPNGFGPVFSIVLKSELAARSLPGLLRFFVHATSLGGVESLIEWRALSDSRVDRKLLRLSIGIENWEDLKNDLLQAFQCVMHSTE